MRDQRRGAEEGDQAERAAPERGKEQQAGAGEGFELGGFHAAVRCKKCSARLPRGTPFATASAQLNLEERR